jgi:hypothetical protein
MKSCVLATLAVVLSLIGAVACACAGEPSQPPDAAKPVSRAKSQAARQTNPRSNIPNPLDRVANAVDGAESSRGEDPGMWRLDPAGPQGPMQVSEAAATDVGGGDRFDTVQNRALGRAYLAQLYWRYKNWPDAIAAYNWGIGNLDAWVKAGRPPDKFLTAVALYLRRVLHDSGLCDDPPVRRASRKTVPVSPQQQQTDAGGEASQAETFEHAVCRDFASWVGAPDGIDHHVLLLPSQFYSKFLKAMGLTPAHVEQSNGLSLIRDQAAQQWAMALRRR